MKNDLDINFKKDQQRIKQSVQKIEELNLVGENTGNLVERLQKLNQLLNLREELRAAEYNLVKDFEDFENQKI